MQSKPIKRVPLRPGIHWLWDPKPEEIKRFCFKRGHRPMPPVPMLLTVNKIRKASTWPEYGNIIRSFIAGDIDERRMWSQLSTLGKIQ